MPNPVLNEKTFRSAAAATQPGWGAPTNIPPSGDTASPWRPSGPTPVMTVNGTVTATGVLLVLLSATAVVGWQSTDVVVDEIGRSFAQPPGWVLATFFGAIGLGFVSAFKPMWARITGPLYALLMGTALGAISKVYATEFDGIVLQAVIGTFSVLGVMLFLHATRILKVTDKFRRVVIYSTLAIGVVYLVNLVMNLFGGDGIGFLHDTGPIGIGISLVVIVIAAFNLSLDFDFIERASAARAPKALEWMGALGLVMTLVWLYLEILRLLSKLQQR